MTSTAAPRTRDYLSQICLRLRNADPENWDRFIEAFDVDATEFTVAVTTAEQSEILVAQGRAQQSLSLLRLFRECGSRIPTRSPPSQ